MNTFNPMADGVFCYFDLVGKEEGTYILAESLSRPGTRHIWRAKMVNVLLRFISFRQYQKAEDMARANDGVVWLVPASGRYGWNIRKTFPKNFVERELPFIRLSLRCGIVKYEPTGKMLYRKEDA